MFPDLVAVLAGRDLFVYWTDEDLAVTIRDPLEDRNLIDYDIMLPVLKQKAFVPRPAFPWGWVFVGAASGAVLAGAIAYLICSIGSP